MLFSARKSREEQENPRKVQLFSNLPIRDHGCAPIEEFHQLLWLVQSKLSRTWTNQSSWWNSRFGSRNSSIGAQPWSRINRLLNSWTFLRFSCSSRLLRALNKMYVEGISLGYMKMVVFVHLFSRFMVTYVESFPTFATTFAQLPFSLRSMILPGIVFEWRGVVLSTLSIFIVT